METPSKPPAADATREKELHPPPSGAVSDSLSSYKEYPAHRPFISTLVHHTPETRTHKSYRPPSSIKACPESNSAAILSALRNLQERIRRLELEKGHGELGLHSVRKDASHTSKSAKTAQADMRTEARDQSNCNQALITHLAAAESRCVKLERQLTHTRRMLLHAKADRTNLLKQQVSVGPARSADQQTGAASQRVQLEKLDRLEQEYLRLTYTQNRAEVKIHELELKLLEEEHQRKLVQDKANQIQTGLETNRILLQSVSPCLSTTQAREKRRNSKKSSSRQWSCTQPHNRMSLKHVPFVAGTSAGCSHSVRANIQSVLSLLKQHQPDLCNNRVLSNNQNTRETGNRRQSDSSSSSSSSTSEQELSELLQALREELRLMSLEQDELMRQLEVSVSQQERNELQMEQERLLLKMERKGEQISKLCKHKSQIKKLRKQASTRRDSGNEVRVTTTVATRGRSAGRVQLKPGERSKRNLRLLRDMKALQSSLQT